MANLVKKAIKRLFDAKDAIYHAQIHVAPEVKVAPRASSTFAKGKTLLYTFDAIEQQIDGLIRLLRLLEQDYCMITKVHLEREEGEG